MNAELISNQEFTECPDCKAQIPFHLGYITWCECGYNLNPIIKEVRKSRIEKLYERMGEKSGQFIYKKMVEQEEVRPRIMLANGLAILFASVIHFLSLTLFLLGIYLLVFDHSHFTYIVFGLVFLGVSWFTRPRFGKLKKEEKIAARKEFPELYGMIDDLAVSMGTNKIDGIILDESYNASITKIGWRRKTIVRIGLPLFSALTPDEQCAILAHELGHYLNKDLTYGFYIGTALDTLAEWYDMLDPVDSDQQFEYTVIEMVTTIVMKAISIIPYFLYFILLHLLWNDSQTGEYLADYRAAEMSGSETTGKALEKFHYNDVFFHILSKVSLRDDNVNVIDEFKRALEIMPEREKQRLKIRLGNEKFKLNTTHPPTTFRIQFVQKQNLPPRVTVDPKRTQKIQAEFEAIKDKIHEEAVEDYRYYRLMI